MLGSGCIVGLSATIPVWQKGLELTTGQVGIVSGGLTFAIAFGSLFTGQISKAFGLIRSFNWINLFYAIGAAVCILATSFPMLLLGVIIMGVASGADLPLSLTVVSHDAPDEHTSARLISSTQIFWQVGIFISYICSFLLSGIEGVLGARIVFAILFTFAVITWLWRTLSPKFRQFHEAGAARQAMTKVTSDSKEVSFKTVLFGENKQKYLGFFAAILIFYVCWNLLANTWGQFQTYALTNAGASQAQATGLGIGLNVISLATTIAFASVAGGKFRNKAFFIGAVVQFGAMLGMALIGGGAGFIALAITIAFYNFGNPLAGEAIYKVWTQESFPAETRASLQGFINAPLYLQLKFAEVPAELAADSSAYDGWLSKSWIQEEFIHLDVLPARLELPRRYSCRYIELKVLDTSPKWQASFSDPLFIAESCVSLDQLPKPVIADEELASIYQVSVKTLFDCMQEVFEDGPKRDRRLWIGDLRLQALANYATFGDLALTKRCLYLFGGMTTSEGKIPANVFTAPQLTPDDTFLFDYSLFFAVILADFYHQTKDSVVLQDLYPVAKKQMELALTCVDEEGRLNLLEEWPVFIDWSNEFEKSTAGQAVLIYAMKRFNQLAEQMKDPQLSHYQETTEKLIAFAKQQLFDEEQKQFIIETTGEINVASQVWMVLAEVFDQPMNREILETMIAHHFPITGIATPYMYHHVVEALFVAGLQEEAIQLMKNYWGKMIQLGADTFWEAFKPEEPDFSPYGSPIISSYCHAWSCTPAYLIEKYLN
ncbi:MFS transporter [Enterococcus hirae]